jgi:hypothetical protein
MRIHAGWNFRKGQARSGAYTAGGRGAFRDWTMVEELHVLFGGGQVGQPLARILFGRGKRVRIVKRSAGGVPEGIELMQGDATDMHSMQPISRSP